MEQIEQTKTAEQTAREQIENTIGVLEKELAALQVERNQACAVEVGEFDFDLLEKLADKIDKKNAEINEKSKELEKAKQAEEEVQRAALARKLEELQEERLELDGKLMGLKKELSEGARNFDRGRELQKRWRDVKEEIGRLEGVKMARTEPAEGSTSGADK